MTAREVINNAIEKHGKDIQTTVCMEECAELIQVISKMKRGQRKEENLIEEMADVLVCIDMLKEIYSISEEELWREYNFKIDRLRQRLGGNDDESNK